jgi:uncharacterized phage protein gp47/JayE
VLRADDLNIPFSAGISSNLQFDEVASTAPFTCKIVGPTSLPALALDAIVTPLDGWDSVENPNQGIVGTLREQDPPFRIRRRQAVANPGTNQRDAIEAGIANLTGVIQVKVLENKTKVVDVNGQEPNSIWAIVLGGDPTDIAQILYDRVSGGIPTVGAQTVNIASPITGQQFAQHFDRPVEIPAYIKVTLTKDLRYPGDGDDQIKKALVAYGDANLGIGAEMDWSRLYTPINSIPGHKIADGSLKIGLAPSPSGTADLTCTVSQRLRIALERIDIQETP